MTKAKKIIVIPDLHQAPNLNQVEQAIARERPDLTVFLGDYFDQFDDTPRDAGRTAEWLWHSLRQPKRIHLWGNHDLPYGYPENPVVRCPGFTIEKFEAIQSHLGEPDWQKLRLCHWEGHRLFSHAGWSKHWFNPSPASPDPRTNLAAHERAAWEALRVRHDHWIFDVGFRRGGRVVAGGLVWCDLREFEPIPCIDQFFGHTPGMLGRYVPGDRSTNWCLDTTDRAGLHHYLVIEGDRIGVCRVDGSPEPAFRPKSQSGPAR
jgi:hypothetical protein